MAAPETASAEGGLFGALIRLLSGQHPNAPSAEPQSPLPLPGISGGDRNIGQDMETGNPSQTVSYCVRTCDGRYFPVGKNTGVTPAKICQSMCPAAATKIYSGNTIDSAVARDGSRYAGLANAYLYRNRLVGGCTCNGDNAGGNAAIAIENDPTLRAGDIVMTTNGPVVFTGPSGPHHKTSEFVPARDSRDISHATRATVMAMKVEQAAISTGKAPPPAATPKTSRDVSDAFGFMPKPKSPALGYSEP